jgi:hypothetical protein
MALFAKNKPKERVDFEGGFVELQYLSKGVKDEIKKRSTAFFTEIDPETFKKVQNGEITDDKDLPLSTLNSVGALLEVEYFKLAHAIHSWSDSAPITEETVKEIDEEIFDRISKKIDEMNELTSTQRKN